MTTIHAQGTSEAFYRAERATVTARVSMAHQDRSRSIEATTRLHNQVVTRAKQLRDSGDATWHAADPIHTYARKTPAEGKKNTYVTEHVTSSIVRIKLANLELVSELVTQLSEAGASTNVSWSLTEASKREHERTARKAAVGQARAIAEDYAAALGENIVRVLSISDLAGGGAQPVGMMRAMGAPPMDSPAEVTVAEITVSATVTGEFQSA